MSKKTTQRPLFPSLSVLLRVVNIGSEEVGVDETLRQRRVDVVLVDLVRSPHLPIAARGNRQLGVMGGERLGEEIGMK